jgi:hypothetical protein
MKSKKRKSGFGALPRVGTRSLLRVVLVPNLLSHGPKVNHQINSVIGRRVSTLKAPGGLKIFRYDTSLTFTYPGQTEQSLVCNHMTPNSASLNPSFDLSFSSRIISYFFTLLLYRLESFIHC